MTGGERLANVLFGLSVGSWAVLHIAMAPAGDRFAAPRLSVASINAIAAVLFLVRGPLRRHGALWQLMAALPSFVLAGAALKWSPPRAEWSVVAQGLIAGGATVTVISLFWLGRSFALLPALRESVVTGPYAVVRHPAYLGELVMVAGCAVSDLGGPSTWLALAVLPALVVRLIAEEALLGEDKEYRAYAERVRWRLVPLIW